MSITNYLLLCRTKIRQFSICYQGPKFFDYLVTRLAYRPSHWKYHQQARLSRTHLFACPIAPQNITFSRYICTAHPHEILYVRSVTFHHHHCNGKPTYHKPLVSVPASSALQFCKWCSQGPRKGVVNQVNEMKFYSTRKKLLIRNLDSFWNASPWEACQNFWVKSTAVTVCWYTSKYFEDLIKNYSLILQRMWKFVIDSPTTNYPVVVRRTSADTMDEPTVAADYKPCLFLGDFPTA